MIHNIFSSHHRSSTTNYQPPTIGSKGFTLLELLVVIAIIGILFSLATASFSTAQKKARDARRIEDMKAIQNAMEQYYAVHNAYPTPPCPSSGDTLYIDDDVSFVIPSDPKGTYPYTSECFKEGTGYCYCAVVEDEKVSNSNNDECHFASPGGQYYCVKNLQ